MEKDKLNLGCGNNIREGCVNLDIRKLPGVDVVHDLTKTPLPFKDNTFTEIICKDILEHLEYSDLMPELYRILKSDGMLIIRVPHFTSRHNFIDPTHKKMSSIRTFEFFIKNTPFRRDYYFDFPGFSKQVSSFISFEKKIFLYNYIVELVINIHPKIMAFYEATFLCSLFPAEFINVVLKK